MNLRLVILWVAVYLAFQFGHDLGRPLSFLLGTATFVGVLFGFDLFDQRIRTADRQDFLGFIIRHRESMLGFAGVLVGGIFGRYLFDGNSWGITAGTITGFLCGNWLSQQLGWSGRALDDQFDLRFGCVMILVAAAESRLGTGKASRTSDSLLANTVRTLITPLGLGSDADLDAWIAKASEHLTQSDSLPTLISHMPAPALENIELDVLRIAFASNPTSETARQWVRSFYDAAGPKLPDRSIRALFDRELGAQTKNRELLLSELGLDVRATPEDIKRAYHQIVRDYHPDRLQGQPEHLCRLARIKLESANAAYGALTGRGTESCDRLSFNTGDGNTMRPDSDDMELICKCWVCTAPNRIPVNARRETARCGVCRALLGLSQSTTAG